MDHTCFPLGGGDSWVTSSSPHICPAALLGGPTQTLASSSGGHSPRLSQCFPVSTSRAFWWPSCGRSAWNWSWPGTLDTSDSSDLDESLMVRGRCKRGSSWSHGVGTTAQQGSKRLKGPDPTYVTPSLRQSNSKVGPVTGGVTDISPLSSS